MTHTNYFVSVHVELKNIHVFVVEFDNPKLRDIKIFVIGHWGLGRFIVIRAIEHNLLPCKIIELKKLMVKNGGENKIKTQIFQFF